MAEPSKEVYELQHMLRKIAQITGGVPLINTDGIYGEATREAVSVFQQENGLPVTGEVDKATWDRIFAVYKDSVYATAQAEPI
jgi:peptidoglycan hydrolase-like protein with peptidoglycan-binding domain